MILLGRLGRVVAAPRLLALHFPALGKRSPGFDWSKSLAEARSQGCFALRTVSSQTGPWRSKWLLPVHANRKRWPGFSIPISCRSSPIGLILLRICIYCACPIWGESRWHDCSRTPR